MTDKKVWLITGDGRGMGVDSAKAALEAGHSLSRPDVILRKSQLRSVTMPTY